MLMVALIWVAWVTNIEVGSLKSESPKENTIPPRKGRDFCLIQSPFRAINGLPLRLQKICVLLRRLLRFFTEKIMVNDKRKRFKVSLRQKSFV